MVATVFVDLDGTLVTGDMHHTLIAFVMHLPNVLQRVRKVIFLILLLPIVGLVSILPNTGEGLAIRMLCYIAMSGVSIKDCEHAVAKGVTANLMARTIPRVAAELRCHVAAGRPVTVLTGNLAPLVADYCDELRVGCLATEAHCGNNSVYSGRLVGVPFVGEEKAVAVLAALTEENDLRASFGYGNSVHDLPFMKLVGNPVAVLPSSSLKKHAESMGWTRRLFDPWEELPEEDNFQPSAQNHELSWDLQELYQV